MSPSARHAEAALDADDRLPDIGDALDPDGLEDGQPPEAADAPPPTLASASWRFLLVLALCIALCLSEPWIADEDVKTVAAIVLLFVFVPVILVTWFDVARALREVSIDGERYRLARFMASLPQALFGLISLVCGLGIGAWVLYNSFVERLPHYRGGFLTFGIGPALIGIGWYWLRGAFSAHMRHPW